MKKIYSIIISCISLAPVMAQNNVGIGTNTPAASSVLDITATNKGLLLPRIALTATNSSSPVTTPATSLMVYNTATAGTAPNNVTPGFYYWDGAKWVRVANSSDIDWIKATTTATPATSTDHQYVTGNVGLGNFSASAPSAKLDVIGNGLFRNGNASNAFTNDQLLFGYNGTNTYMHSIKSRHNGSSATGNSIDFFLWKQGTDATTSVGTQQVMTLDGNNNGSVGIGTTSPLSKFMVYNGITNQLTAAQAGTAVATFDGGSGTTNTRVLIGSNWTASGTRPESQLEFWNNAFGGGETNSATISTLSSQGSSAGAVNGSLLFSTANNATSPVERMRLWNLSTDALLQLRPTAATNWARLGTNGSSLALLTQGTDNTSFSPSMFIENTGYVGIGTTSPNAPLQFANAIANRKIVFWETADNDHQYYGFGVNNSTLRYQVDAAAAKHAFFCGTSTTTSKQIMTINGDGNIYIGNPSAITDAFILPVNPIGGSNATYLRLGTSSNQLQDIYTNFVYCSAKVNIGSTASATFPLEVTGSPGSQSTNSGRGSYYGSGSQSNQSAYTGTDIVAKFNGRVWATTSFEASSDRRIKNIIGVTNSVNDLGTLLKIAIVDYTMKDKIGDGDREYKKVIAQDVAAVYPTVVSYTTDVVPDIFAVYPIKYNNNIATVSLDRSFGIKIGDKIRLVDESNTKIDITVTDTANGTFSFLQPATISPDISKIFVYGREVNDKALVDYDGLTTLNISATQELYKKIVSLEKENAELSSALSTKADNKDINELKAEIEQLKKLVLSAGLQAKN